MEKKQFKVVLIGCGTIALNHFMALEYVKNAKVVAVCDIGEGSRSLRRRTNTKVAHWDNRPDLGFVRDTRSNEHGYPGFLYMTNQDMPILNYPED